MNTRLDYRISCLLSIFRREFDDSKPSIKAQIQSTNGGVYPTIDSMEKRIDLEAIGLKAESIFDNSIGGEDVGYAVDLDLVIIKKLFIH